MAEGDTPAEAPPTERETASRTFFTTIEAAPEPKVKPRHTLRNKCRALESTNAGPRITEHNQDLQELANTLDRRMASLLREHEKDFFLAYKTHMYTVQKEIKATKIKADLEESQMREDTKIKALEGELDWFMTEAFRLDELCKGYKKEVDKWKAKSDALDEDRCFLEEQIKGAKRQNKILRAASERARSSANSALLATRARTEVLERGAGADAGDQLAMTAPPRAEVSRRPASASGGGGDGFRPAAGSGAKRALEARSRTPEPQQALAALPPAAPPARTGYPAAALAPLSNTMSAASLGGMGGRSVLGTEAEERYVEAIQHLKQSIVREQHTVRMLQAARATSYSHKSELEEFFLKCVDEARKELTRKQHLTMYREKDEREKVLEAMLNNEDVLVCLYEKLFPHRTGIARSLGGAAGGGGDARLLSQMSLEDTAGLAR